MIQIILGVVLAVERHGFDIDILIAVVRGVDHQVVSILKMDRSLLEQRSAQHILGRTRSDRIES